MIYVCNSASKRIMGAAGVPLVPGYHGVEQDIDFMKLEADKIGYPLIIKPTHGGGGKVCLSSLPTPPPHHQVIDNVVNIDF